MKLKYMCNSNKWTCIFFMDFKIINNHKIRHISCFLSTYSFLDISFSELFPLFEISSDDDDQSKLMSNLSILLNYRK